MELTRRKEQKIRLAMEDPRRLFANPGNSRHDTDLMEDSVLVSGHLTGLNRSSVDADSKMVTPIPGNVYPVCDRDIIIAYVIMPW